jgi:hypothetical protein
MNVEVRRAATWSVLVTVVLAVLIIAGSRNLEHFDAALVGYTYATLFATFAVTYRYTMWLQRPPTAIYWRRGWQVFTKRGHLARNLFVRWPKHVIGDIALNRFILNRGALRWLMHWLIMSGCILAVLITFPLVFGWLYFASVPGDPEAYRVMVFGFPTVSFPAESAVAFIAFHGLVWASFLVIGGVMLAMRRRMREEGAAALQRFGEDMLPLVALFAISVTGLMLTASYTWMDGYAYEFLAILHAVTVILWLLWLPFGKFFHIFQRPAQVGVRFYKDIGALEEPARCRRCGHAFTSRMKVLDLIDTEQRLGYAYEMPNGGEASAAEGAHYQWICPPCRRALLALAQGRLWSGSRGRVEGMSPMPIYANPGLGEGPLGTEDAANFHP